MSIPTLRYAPKCATTAGTGFSIAGRISLAIGSIQWAYWGFVSWASNKQFGYWKNENSEKLKPAEGNLHVYFIILTVEGKHPFQHLLGKYTINCGNQAGHDPCDTWA